MEKQVGLGSGCRPTRRGADAHPCALMNRALPAKASVIQARLASGGGWARLTPTVGPQELHTMSRKICSAVLLVGVCLLTACISPSPQASVASAPVPGPVVPVGQPEMRDLGPTTETVWNCGSGGGTVVKHPTMSVVTNHAVEWQVGGTVGVGVKIGEGIIPGGADLSASLEGRYVSRLEQGIQQGTGWDLPAEPNTIMVYTLMWREVWQPGYIYVRLADQNVVRVDIRYRTGIQSEIVGKQKQTCGGEQTPPVQPGGQPALTAQPIPTMQARSQGPFHEHRQDSIGSGIFSQVTYSDGLAPFTQQELNTSHSRLQLINPDTTSDGCGVAVYNVEKIWFGAASRTTLMVNGSPVGEVYAGTGKHGYIVNLTIRVNDRICVNPVPPGGFHINFGPDLYYHYDSYCYRGHCD